MKVLIISHNAIGSSTSMGITLKQLFSDWQKNSIAQLYFYPEDIDTEIVGESFRFTDLDAIKSIINHSNSKHHIHSNVSGLTNTPTNNGLIKRIYQFGRKRSSLIYILRDALWLFSKWKTNDLKEWLNKVNPDIIFFASGDYCFSNRIAEFAADYCSCPLIVSCMDDYYLFSKNSSILGIVHHKLFLKSVNRLINKSYAITVICEEMAKQYNHLFNKKCIVLYTPSEECQINYKRDAHKLAYFGSLGLGRDQQLYEIAECLDMFSNKCKTKNIDIYTFEDRDSVLSRFNNTNVIVHNGVSKQEMKSILSDCLAVIHTESFDHSLMNRTKYSISTKIPESLMYGPCIFAYGPESIASISYLKNNNAAIVATTPDSLIDKLQDLLFDNELRSDTVSNARTLAYKHHTQSQVSNQLMELFESAINCSNHC